MVIHQRMPVILPPEAYDRWLDAETLVTELQRLLAQFPAGRMRTYPVTTWVNDPRNDDQLCLAPALGTDTT